MKVIKYIFFLILTGIAIVLLSTCWNFENERAFETIAIFLSITTGFTITALSIVATSKFSKHLYLIEDADNNSKTLLHKLVRQFQFSSLFFVVTIGLILLYQFLPASSDLHFFSFKGYDITAKTTLKSAIWIMTFFSFYKFLRIFNMFSDFVIQTAKKE